MAQAIVCLARHVIQNILKKKVFRKIEAKNGVKIEFAVWGEEVLRTQEKLQTAAKKTDNAERTDSQREKKRTSRKSGRVALSGVALGDVDFWTGHTSSAHLQLNVGALPI